MEQALVNARTQAARARAGAIDAAEAAGRNCIAEYASMIDTVSAPENSVILAPTWPADPLTAVTVRVRPRSASLSPSASKTSESTVKPELIPDAFANLRAFMHLGPTRRSRYNHSD